jgi:hypothetical protein
MNDTVFLDVGAVAYLDISKISPQNGSWANVAVLPDGHPADEDSSRMHKRGLSNLRLFPFEFINGHWIKSFLEGFEDYEKYRV